jgi:NarL family two-component system sensor histidine kinase YdfH
VTALKNKLKSLFGQDLNESIFSKSPMVVGIILLYAATVFVGNSDKLSLNEIAGYTIVMIIQVTLFLFSNTIFKRRYWLYFVIQGIITFDYAVISPKGYETIFYGLIPLFVIQSMIVYTDAIKVIITAISFYSIYCGTIVLISGTKELIQSIPLLIIITISLRVYSALFFKQVKLRIQTQKVLKELELAYERVEELTLTNERQRMARDLHDTLSQGLAGVIMQLEAVNANLNNNNAKRAQEIIQKSMEHARKTLADSRLLIDDLRLHTNIVIDIEKALENEIAAFKNISNTYVKADIRIETAIPVKVSKHILYIVREALNNIARHAEAKNAFVEIIGIDNQISIDIKDDGVGFSVKLLDQLFGHYGILGMTERVKAINGMIKIKSKRKTGTHINIIIPIEKGTDTDNE